MSVNENSHSGYVIGFVAVALSVSPAIKVLSLIPSFSAAFAVNVFHRGCYTVAAFLCPMQVICAARGLLMFISLDSVIFV